jgi:hypothetical protein
MGGKTVVAFNLGTVIVLVLAGLFFGSILFLGTHSRARPHGGGTTVGESVAPKATASAKDVKPSKWGARPREAPVRHPKGKREMHRDSRI